MLLKWAFVMPFAGLYLEVYDILADYLTCVTPLLGETHPDVLKALLFQAFSSWCNGHYREAVSISKPIYKAYVRTMGLECPDTLFIASGIFLTSVYVEIDDEVRMYIRLQTQFDGPPCLCVLVYVIPTSLMHRSLILVIYSAHSMKRYVAQHSALHQTSWDATTHYH
jgi:hypothetical protein